MNWAERLGKAALRKSHWSGDLKDEILRKGEKKTRNIMRKNLCQRGNIASLRDRSMWLAHRLQKRVLQYETGDQTKQDLVDHTENLHPFLEKQRGDLT